MKILKHWLKVITTKSSGPGGQNVNKLNTKVDMRLPLPLLSKEIRDLVIEKYPSRVNKSLELFVSSDSSRSQTQNYNNCLEKLQEIIDSSLPPEPVKVDLAKKELIKGHKDKFQKNKEKEKRMNSLKKSFRKSFRDF